MAPFWESISSSFGRSVGFGVSESDNDYLPPTPSGKRKASEPRRSSRSAKARRRSALDSHRRAPGTYTTISEEDELTRPQHLSQRHERLSDIVEEDEQSPRVTGFIGHRNSLDRRSSAKKGSVSKRHSSEQRDSGYAGSSTNTRRRPSTPIRPASVKSVQGANEDYLSGVASVVKTAISKFTGAGQAEPEKPAATEADMQDQLLAELTDEEVQAQSLAEFADGYDTADFSEGERARWYFRPAPWSKHRAEWEDKVMRDPQIKPRPRKTATPAPTFVSYNFKPRSEVKPVALEKPEKKPEKKLEKTPEKKPEKKPENKPEKNPVTKGVVKSVNRPVYQPAVDGPSQDKPVTSKKPPKEPVTKNSVEPVREPAVEPPEYIKEWTEAPYQRLRTIYEEHPTSYLTEAQKELQEPVYAIRDVEVRDMMWQVQDGIEEVAAFFQGTLPLVWGKEKSKTLTRIYPDRDPSTSRVLKGVVGMGWEDEEEWHDIFAGDEKRRALVCGIIGNVLIEQVFKHPFFGGDKPTIDTLFRIQRELRDEDAFARKHDSAWLLSSNLIGQNPNKNPNEPKSILHPPKNFTTHVDVVVTALDTHLRPLLLKLCTFNARSKERTARVHWSFIEALTRLVGTAGLLSLQVAVDPFTVYYHVPLANGDRFSHALHEAFNHEEMERSHPRNPETAFASEEARKRASNDEAVISMVLMNGLTAYRAGGWEAPESDPGWDGEGFVGRVYAREGNGGRGHRERVLAHGWVFCKWGRARRFG
ncbi:hypothetical protein P171DRAFT_479643 [Karstenula rhodostoma CBS 690.94]|uniref:Uncharacterized protein n=1 Tax=Karstenula rhodostoma CBS 690.94 TaxID=1392251 RepID=A0A9P4UHT4_9PLEO|nr:hypothetical protein P171DRAFT_479643 [Karstenula rhodostoma CBS 690.94]